MSDHRHMLAETVERLFRDAAETADGEWPAALWTHAEESALPALFVPEDRGGFGGTWEDASVVLNLAGLHGISLPIAEAMLAGKVLAEAGIDLPDGPIGVAQLEDTGMSGGRLTGVARAVPWGAKLRHLAVIHEAGGAARISLLASEAVSAAGTHANAAGEPRADLRIDGEPLADAPAPAADLFRAGALMRTAQMAGAIEGVLAMSVQYTKDRSQFGRPISAFQAVQQQLAVLATESAALTCAAGAACRAASRGEARFEIAAAKLRANLAVGPATAIGHAVHGAIGFTREYRLNRLTRRLWSWRGEYGGDRHWALELGGDVAAHGAGAFWPRMTARL